MKSYKAILFDLDGTLTDSKEGICKGVKYALEKMNIPLQDNLLKFIGPPLAESFQKYYGMGEEEAREAVRLYRIYYCQQGMYENQPYEGTRRVLEQLSQRGYRLYVATSKPENQAREILEHFSLAQYFVDIVGHIDGMRDSKKAVIGEIVQREGLSSFMLMVGDHVYDGEGARAWGIDFGACFYGYGDRESLMELRPKMKLDSIGDLLNYL